MFSIKPFKKKKNKKKFFSFPGILAYSFAVVAIIQTLSLSLAFQSPEMARAAEKKQTTYEMQVSIPGLGDTIEFGDTTEPIVRYIEAIYNYAIGIVGILAAIMLMVGGFRWILAGGNASSISEAKEMIFAALSGLVLVMTSYLILNIVNPDLTELKITDIKEPNGKADTTEKYSNMGACNWKEEKTQTSEAFSIAQEETCNSFNSVLSSDENCTTAKPSSTNSTNYKCCCEYNKDSDANCSWQSILTSCSGDNTSFTGDEAIKKCGSTGYTSSNICCCQLHSFYNLSCQGNVCQQKKDADESLINAIDCFGKRLVGISVKISSISDNHLLTNNWDYCTTNYPGQCQNNNSDSKTCCYHSENSCHYGGGISGQEKSFAIDLVGDKDSIEKIANQYKSECGIGYVLNEGDHIHISTTACPRQ